ncbi:hypothetical protein SM139_2457, partial [Stenotrophomonas maltophilia]
RR